MGKIYPASETVKAGSPPRAYDYPVKAVRQIHSTWRESLLCSRHHILSENWWTLVPSWHYYRRALILPASSTLLLEGLIVRLINYAHSQPTSRIHSTLTLRKGARREEASLRGPICFSMTKNQSMRYLQCLMSGQLREVKIGYIVQWS